MMRTASRSLLTLIALAPLGAAAERMNYTNVPQPISLNAPDLSVVAKARFFVSSDEGKSWSLAQEMPVATDAKVPPRFEFRPPTDGSYIIVTRAVWRNGTTEKDPQPGIIPEKALYLTVDTFKPVIGSLAATLDKAAPDRAVVQVTWSASDANFGTDPVAIEASGDNGASWPLSFPGQSQGSAKITVPVTRDTRAVLVRVVAKDQAKNIATSEVKTVTLPAPPDPNVEVKKAVSSLPSIAEIEPVAKPVGGGDSAAKPASGATTHGDRPLQDAVEPATASADPNKPDIIAPNADPTLSNPADGALVADGNVEADYQHASDPSDAPHGFKPDRRPQAAPDEEPEAAPVVEDTHFIPNPGAEVVLEKAREQAKAGDSDAALATYHRLHNSGQARVAIAEELQLLQDKGEQQRIIDTVAALPSESINDAARLRQGRALIALKSHGPALAALSRIRAGAPEAREAMYLISRCFIAENRLPEAKKVLGMLAKGDDEWATKARQEH